MSLPRLNRRLTLEKPVRVPDDAGGYVETWTPVGVVWAEVRARTGREVAASGTVVSRVPYAIVVRGAPVGHPGRPAPEQRFRDGQRCSISAVSPSMTPMADTSFASRKRRW